MTNRRFVGLILSIPVVAGLLVGACVSAAGAAELSAAGNRCDLYEADCTERPLANGRAGEVVRECARVALVCTYGTASTTRKGSTVLYHVDTDGKLVAAK